MGNENCENHNTSSSSNEDVIDNRINDKEMNSLDSFALLWEERKDLLSSGERAYIQNKLDTYNKIKIKSPYTSFPQYYTSSPTIYTTQGGLSDAG